MKNKYKTLFVISILFLVGIVWHLSFLYNSDILYKRTHQVEPDSILFIRMLDKCFIEGKISADDTYQEFPQILDTVSMPFYIPFLVHTTWLIYSLFPAMTVDPTYIAGSIPIVFSLLTQLLILLFLFKHSKDKKLVILTAFFMLPGFCQSYINGFCSLDYDFIISFCIWSFICCYILYKNTFENKYILLSGVCASIFIASWRSAPFFFLLVTIYGAILWLIKNKNTQIYIEYASQTMFISSGVNIVYILINSDVLTKYGVFATHYSFSQPLALLIASCFLSYLLQCNRFSKPRLYASLSFLIAILLLLCFSSELTQNSKLLFFGRDSVSDSIMEYQSIFLKSKSISELFGMVISFWGVPLLLLPLLYSKSTGLKKSDANFLKFWLSILLFLAIRQFRFIKWWGSGIGLASGIIIYNLWKIFPYTHKTIRLVKITIFSLICISSCFFSFFSFNLIPALETDRIDLYNWIRKNTPITSGLTDVNKPEYGILTYWHQGNLLCYYAQRPIVTGNTGLGVDLMAKVFESKSEKEAVSLFEKNRIRYFLLNPGICDIDSDKTYTRWYDKINEPSLFESTIDNLDNSCFYYWMDEKFALSKFGSFSASSRFRAIYASNLKNDNEPEHLLFEFVNGSEITVRADPESFVTTTLEIEISGIKKQFKSEQIVGKNGLCTFRVPYSTGYDNSGIKTALWYEINFFQNKKEWIRRVQITETDVTKGLNIP